MLLQFVKLRKNTFDLICCLVILWGNCRLTSFIREWQAIYPARAATREKFRRRQQSFLATIMTSLMCSQTWCDIFAMTSLPTVAEESFS